MKLATLCYIKKDGKTLMLHRTKKKNDIHEWKRNGLWGKLELWESPEDCVIREIKEESGLDIKNFNMRGFLTFPSFAHWEDWYVFVFTATDFDGELIDSREWDLSWIDDDKLLDLNLREGDKIFMKQMAEDGFFSGKLIYKDGSLVQYEMNVYS